MWVKLHIPLSRPFDPTAFEPHLTAPEPTELMSLREENSRLRTLVAELLLKNESFRSLPQ